MPFRQTTPHGAHANRFPNPALHASADGEAARRPDVRRLALGAVTILLVYGAFRTLWPFASALVLGAWAGHLLRPIYDWLRRKLHARQGAAAVVTAALLVLLAAPIAAAVLTIVPAAQSLVDEMRSGGTAAALRGLVSSGDTGSAQSIVKLLRDHGAAASKMASVVMGASVQAIVGVFVFFVVFFGALVQGERLATWLDRHVPLDVDAIHRLRGAFFQAGRGLIVGNGLTALAQGLAATITYVALGVPRWPVLGFLTVIGALIPLTGPAIVWVPVAIGLVIAGHAVKAAILAAVGIFVVGTIDNIVRPYLAERAHVGLDTSVVIIAMFGGIALFGAWGIFLGPLVVRLALEALAIVRDRGLVGGGRASS